MSVSRYVQKLIEPYILDYLDPDGEKRKVTKDPADVKVTLSSNSYLIDSLFTKKRVLTLFLDNKKPYKKIANAYRKAANAYRDLNRDANPCIKSCKSVNAADGNHDSYHHILEKEIHFNHIHYHKGLQDPEYITAQELQCLINKVKQIENQESICLDGTTDCLLSDEDSKKIVNAYAPYARAAQRIPASKVRAAQLKATAKTMAEDITDKCVTGVNSFVNAFMTTLFDKYIKPALISNNQVYMYASIGLLESVNLYLSEFLKLASFQYKAIDIGLRNLMSPLLIKLGMNPAYVEPLMSGIGTMVAVTKDPYSILEFGLKGTGAMAGQAAAWRLIRQLPKLKEEPPVADVVVDNKENTVNHVTTDATETYRRRKR